MDGQRGQRPTLDAFGEPPSAPLTTSEVAAEFEASHRTVYERLRRLADEGVLETKKVGARGRIWWRPLPDEADPAAPDHADESACARAVVDAVEAVVLSLDDDLRVRYANDAARDRFEEERIAGARLGTILPGASELREACRDVRGGSEEVAVDPDCEPFGEGARAIVSPTDAGVSVWITPADVGCPTADRECEYRALVEGFSDGLVARFDDDLRHQLVGGEGFEALSIGPEDLEGKPPEAFLAPEAATQVEAAYRSALEGEGATVEIEQNGRAWRIRTAPVADDGGRAGIAIATDVTCERATRERLRASNRALERLYEISADRERSFEEKVEALLEVGCERLGVESGYLAAVDREEDRFEVVSAVGDRVSEGDVGPLSETYCRRTVGTEGLVVVADAGAEGWDEDPVYRRWEHDCYVGGTVRADDECYGTLCFVDGDPRSAFTEDELAFVELATQWVGYELDRRGHEAELRRYSEYTDRVLDALDDVFYVVEEDGRLRRWNETVEAVTGYPSSAVEEMTLLEFVAPEDRDRARSSFATAFEGRTARLEASFLTADGERIPYEFVGSTLAGPEGDRVMAVVGRDVSGRKERERRLRRRRRELAALNNLYEVVNGTVRTIIEQPSRETIERSVCERLAATDSYAAAWIGEVEGGSQRIVPQTVVDGDRLADRDLTVDSDDWGDRLVGRALRSRSVRAADDLDGHGDLRGAAAIPVVHETTVFGVLTVYTEREDAFADDERAVLTHLGEVIGHAIAAAERKHAALGDDVVELCFRVPEYFDAIGASTSTDGQIEIDRVIPTGDEQFLVYGTADPEDLDAVEAIVEARPQYETVEVVEEDPTACRFELHLSSSPLYTELASAGAVVEAAVVEDGDYRLTVRLPERGDVRRVTEIVTRRFPSAEPIARRHRARPADPTRHLKRTWIDDLTPRQRAALETAFFSGYFEWPRSASGEEIADALDVTNATFSQHLRAAERKLFGALFEELPSNTDA